MNISMIAPYTVAYNNKLNEALSQALDKIQKQAEVIEDLEVKLNDVELELEDEQDKNGCHHDEDERIALWIADIVSQSQFRGVGFLIDEIESKAKEGGIAFPLDIKKTLDELRAGA